MGSDHAPWRQRLLVACNRTLADLHARDDPADAVLIADVQALRDGFQSQLDADRGPSRGGDVTPLEDPSEPTDGK